MPLSGTGIKEGTRSECISWDRGIESFSGKRDIPTFISLVKWAIDETKPPLPRNELPPRVTHTALDLGFETLERG